MIVSPAHRWLPFMAVLIGIGLGAHAWAQPGKKKSPGYHPAPSPHAKAGPKSLAVDAPSGSRVAVVAIDDTVELGLSALVRRAVNENEDASAIILDVNTLGGRVDAAIQIRDALLDAKPRTVAFIHPRAISAGALISLACKNIVMAPGGTIGAATPVQAGGGGQAIAVEEKYVSYMRAEMRATAETNERRGDIAEAMVDREVVIKGIVDAGKLLTLDTDRAIDLAIADATAANIDEVIALLGIENPVIERFEVNWGEEVARVLTGPTLSGLLLSIGMLGIMIAFYTRTVGPFTVIGFICLALFFGGHAVVHLVGWEEALVFGTGVVLIIVEVFFVPGVGVPGVLGGVLIIASLVMSFTALPLDVSFEVGELAEAMTRVMISLLASFVLVAIAAPLVATAAAKRGLVLQDSRAGDLSAPSPSTTLVGKMGEALTDLRPAGKVVIDEVRHEAASEREFVARGDRVRVIRIDGPNVIVRKDESES